MGLYRCKTRKDWPRTGRDGAENDNGLAKTGNGRAKNGNGLAKIGRNGLAKIGMDERRTRRDGRRKVMDGRIHQKNAV